MILIYQHSSQVCKSEVIFVSTILIDKPIPRAFQFRFSLQTNKNGKSAINNIIKTLL